MEFKVEKVDDDTPDLSWIGTYVDRIEPYVIDRMRGILFGDWKQDEDDEEDEGDTGLEILELGLGNTYERHQYRYFKPANPGNTPEDIKCMIGDYERMEDYNRGGWGMQGIVVSTMIGGYELDYVSLWGIETDCGDEYLQEIITDLLHQLDIPKNVARLETQLATLKAEPPVDIEQIARELMESLD